jgi:hypothetical protein
MPTIIDYLLLTVITIFPVLSLGIMLFFSFVIAPTVHKFLPTAQSGPYIRKLFPIYYIINAALAFLRKYNYFGFVCALLFLFNASNQ